MSKTSKNFRAFGADLRYIPMFYMFFVSKIVVFRSFPWFFFAPAAPETLSTHSISFRSNKHKSNTTVQNSGSSPAGVENHLNIDIQLIRRRRRENFGFLASKTQFSYWKHHFCNVLRRFWSRNHWKMVKFFGLRPISQINSPPLFWNPQKQGGGAYGGILIHGDTIVIHCT